MTFIKRIFVSFYYILAKRLISLRSKEINGFNQSQKNIFIYFDYERDFGGHISNITDTEVFSLLRILDQNKIKATWFIVGKIFEEFPETINEIIYNEHEIGSHTFGHIAPLLSKRKTLGADFRSFTNESAKNNVMPSGFHSPNGLWSLRMLKLLNRFNYKYDLAGISGNNRGKPLLLRSSRSKGTVRFTSACDDWQLYLGGKSRTETLDYLKEKYKQVNKGDIVGFGFHPWVLFSNPEILEGFKDFLFFINEQQDNRIETAGYYARAILKSRTH